MRRKRNIKSKNKMRKKRKINRKGKIEEIRI